MRSTFKVLFYLKRDKQKANGMVPLYCRITIDGKEVRFGMKCDVNPKLWDVESGKAVGRTVDAVKTNALVDNTRSAIIGIYRDLQERDNYVTAERVKNVFLGIECKQHTLLELFDRHNRERQKEIGITLCKSLHYFYCKVRERVADFICLYYNVSDIPLKEIDKKFATNFMTYLCTNYKFAFNTRIRHLKCLKHVINVALEEELILRNPISEGFRYQNGDRGYLTQTEVEMFINVQLDKKKEMQARDVFIFCCFTGLAYIDAYNLTSDRLQETFDGKMWIRGRRQKTETEYRIPLLDIPLTILEKYKGTLPDNKVLPVPELGTYCNRLKRIAAKCGISKNVTSHLARHTFATLALTKGVSIESVSKMLGHKGIQTTQIYAKVTDKKIDSDMAMLADKMQQQASNLQIHCTNEFLSVEHALRSFKISTGKTSDGVWRELTDKVWIKLSNTERQIFVSDIGYAKEQPKTMKGFYSVLMDYFLEKVPTNNVVAEVTAEYRQASNF